MVKLKQAMVEPRHQARLSLYALFKSVEGELVKKHGEVTGRVVFKKALEGAVCVFLNDRSVPQDTLDKESPEVKAQRKILMQGFEKIQKPLLVACSKKEGKQAFADDLKTVKTNHLNPSCSYH